MKYWNNNLPKMSWPTLHGHVFLPQIKHRGGSKFSENIFVLWCSIKKQKFFSAEELYWDHQDDTDR